MPVYVFAENTVSNDPNVFFDSEFYHEVTSWMRQNGGERTGAAYNDTVVIKGSQTYNRVILLRFDDMDKVKVWADGLKKITDKFGQRRPPFASSPSTQIQYEDRKRKLERSGHHSENCIFSIYGFTPQNVVGERGPRNVAPFLFPPEAGRAMEHHFAFNVLSMEYFPPQLKVFTGPHLASNQTPVLI